MSLTSALSPGRLTFSSPDTGSIHRAASDGPANVPLHHDSNYLALSRMLTRYQHLILLTPSPNSILSDDLSPLQRKIQAELWSPLPYHRTKWLHNIEGARTLLLQLERAAQAIKIQRVKRDAVRDLAEKRAIIKKLRSRIEEIGRDTESTSDNTWQEPEEEEAETLYDYLQTTRKKRSDSQADIVKSTTADVERSVNNAKPTSVSDDLEKPRKELFSSSSTVRRRQGPTNDEKPDSEAKQSGFSNLPATEKSLLGSSREHEDITTSLVSMAAQLKQQARAFQFSLDQDKGLLDRALEGLDKNSTAMDLASKNMASLRRMSEEQGWLGRLKLYAIIFGMWILAVMLVFVGPKLRF